MDLSFPVSDINDLIKSMVLRDLDGGHVSTVSYDSNAPIERTLKSFAGKLRTGGPGLPQMLVAQMYGAGKPMEIVFSGDTPADALALARQRFLPNAILMRADHTPDASVYSKPGIYVCENFACQLPVTTAEELARLLS